MSDKTTESLSSFMKKQMSEKSSKKNIAKKSSQAANKKSSTDNDDDQEQVIDNEMTEEELLEDAKKASRNKAAQQNQIDMFKKLIKETVGKYVILIAVLAVCSIGIIEIAPALFNLLNGLIFKATIGSLGH